MKLPDHLHNVSTFDKEKLPEHHREINISDLISHWPPREKEILEKAYISARGFMREAEKKCKANGKNLDYNNLTHVHDVVRAATHLGIAEGVRGKKLLLLQLAGIFHDVGYLKFPAGQHVGLSENEKEGARIAVEFMKKYPGLFSKQDREVVKNIIMATVVRMTNTGLRQSHRNNRQLERILADADMRILSAPDSTEQGHRFRRQSEIPFSTREQKAGFFKGQHDFFIGINSGQYQTETAQKYWQAKRDANARRLLRLHKEHATNEKRRDSGRSRPSNARPASTATTRRIAKRAFRV